MAAARMLLAPRTNVLRAVTMCRALLCSSKSSGSSHGLCSSASLNVNDENIKNSHTGNILSNGMSPSSSSSSRINSANMQSSKKVSGEVLKDEKPKATYNYNVDERVLINVYVGLFNMMAYTMVVIMFAYTIKALEEVGRALHGIYTAMNTIGEAGRNVSNTFRRIGTSAKKVGNAMDHFYADGFKLRIVEDGHEITFHIVVIGGELEFRISDSKLPASDGETDDNQPSLLLE